MIKNKRLSLKLDQLKNKLVSWSENFPPNSKVLTKMIQKWKTFRDSRDLGEKLLLWNM